MISQDVTTFGSPLQAIERPTPQPTGTQVLLRTLAAGVCHSDVHIWQGGYDLGHGKRLEMGSRGVALPLTMGHEIVGEVVALGPDAEGVQVGQRVLVFPWIGCGGCANHCPARCILTRDVCQELRVMLYDGTRCTYCGRCADVCPEDAITMNNTFQNASDDRNDVTTRIELFMMTCQRCGRCYEMETTNAIDRLDLKGFRYDNLEQRALIRKSSETFAPDLLAETEGHQRPSR